MINTKRLWNTDKRNTKLCPSSFSNLKVINVIQDFCLPSSRKQTRDNHGDDSLVVTMSIDQCLVKRVLVDTGGSVNVLSKDTFRQIGIPWDKVIPYAAPLVGFTGKTVKSEGKITLLVSIKEIGHMAEFLIIYAPSPYNCKMSRSALN